MGTPSAQTLVGMGVSKSFQELEEVRFTRECAYDHFGS
jgi:hypothetical protein